MLNQSQVFYYKNTEYTDFIDMFKEKIQDELNEMMEDDNAKNQMQRNHKIMIGKSNFDKYSIDKCVSFELKYNEIPSRSLILGNIPEGTSEEDLKYLINSFGDYQELNLDNLKNGKVIVRFYDLRDAMIMRTSYVTISFRSIIMSFGNDLNVIDKKNPPNNGTIVVFNLPENANNNDIHSKFAHLGDIRDIRSTPNKKTQRFIEFYDLRSAEKAKIEMKKKKVIISNSFCKINVEFSLPGNYRANYEKYYVNHIPTIQRRTSTISN